VMLWAPGLLLVLLLFGLPIAHARKLARQGLVGEDRGERFVGLTCLVLAGLAALLARGPMHLDMVLFYAFAVLAAVTGAAAAWIAARREARRRRFVARVEAEEVPGFRVEARPIGKMLVRVEPRIETYRVAPQPDEELFELDAEGRVTSVMASGRVDL
jgi:hypothetical protein